MTALAVEKCTYLAIWSNGVTLEISKFKSIKIAYENDVNSALDDEEKKQINKSTF